MKKLTFLISLIFASPSLAGLGNSGDYLVKVAPQFKESLVMQLQSASGAATKIQDLNYGNWMRVQLPQQKNRALFALQLKAMDGVEYVQPNYKIRLLDFPNLPTGKVEIAAKTTDNPPIPAESTDKTTGPDPLFSKQWGMNDIGVKEAWQHTLGSPDIVVAVIDTGVDYTHEDLVPNLWRNKKEIPNNGIDDDNNGYVDDVIGWDFVSNDNKPFDKMGNVFSGGNPGHGTHCAGNVAARGNNAKGISGVAPNVKIMSLRFISDKGQGTTADAIKAIKYAVDNGAHVTSNSWGSEGEDPEDEEGNRALREIISYSQQMGSLFVAAAGNGHMGAGYNNDTDANPAYPASYDHEIIISVAAIDEKNQLGSFSNWGVRSVDIAAPGVKVFSTIVGGDYSDSVVPYLATWDGTSMAAPHVAGAAALYLSKHPQASWQEVKAAIISSASKLSHLSNKLVSGGKLDVKALMQQ